MKFIRFTRIALFAVGLMIAGQTSATGTFITLASTTSTQASGFFDYYLPLFKKQSGVSVRVIAVGTGQAMKLGENGDADVLLVHDKAGELKFVQQGFGVDRREVMYNDFVFVGPSSDPAGIRDGNDAVKALRKIANTSQPFISRGDDSGTHRMEMRLWRESGIDPTHYRGTRYKEAGAGMGAVLSMTADFGAYTLSDRGTWLSFKKRGELALLDEGDPRLFNQYSVILINPERHPHVKIRDARAFMDWMASPEGQAAISGFNINGEILFKPNTMPVGAKPTGTDG